MKTYTASELRKKFSGKFINVYPHHHEFWNDATNKYETVYEVRGTSKLIRENFQTVDEILS